MMALALERPTLGECGYTLRPRQAAGVEAIRARMSEGARRVLCVAPTGSGKTSLMAAMIRRAVAMGRRVLALAHRSELIDQIHARVVLAGVPSAWVGVIRADDKRRNPGALVQVASVDTLRGRVGTGRMPEAHMVIVDEAHRSAANSYVQIAEAYPRARMVGFTATPWRLDGKGLREQFDDIAVLSTIGEAIDEGHLVPLRCYSHPTGPDLSGVSTSRGDFVTGELAERMLTSVLLGSLVEEWQRRAQGRATFAFAVSIEHAHEIAATFEAAGIPARAIHGGTDPEERARALADLRSGVIQVLANVQLFTEGTDVPEVKCVLLARPTLSHALFFQMIGRGMRPCPSTGYADCVVLDHAGGLAIHGHPLEPQEYNLEPPRKRKVGAALTKDCPSCGEAVPVGTTLCKCGHVWERAERERPTEVAGQLVEAAPRPPVELPASEERRRIHGALAIARKAGAGNVEAYARGILRKQLRREPCPILWGQCVAPLGERGTALLASVAEALAAKRAEAAAPAVPEDDEWSVPAWRPVVASPAPVTVPRAGEPIVEVSF